jgi:hypothetical protein
VAVVCERFQKNPPVQVARGGKQKWQEGQKGQKVLFAPFALLALFASLFTPVKITSRLGAPLS